MNETTHHIPVRYGYSIVCACLLAVAVNGCSGARPLVVAQPIDYASLFADPNNYETQVDQFGRYRVKYPDDTYTIVRFESELHAFIFIWKCCEFATDELEERAAKRRNDALDTEARWRRVEPTMEQPDES